MKKTLAIILSIVMLLGVMPFGAFAADSYDRAKIAANDKDTIFSLSEEQIASLILDWVDRQIAALTEDFESFEVQVMGTAVAVDIPDIKTLDDVITYKDYLAKLEGDFAALDTTNLITRAEAGSAIGFIGGVLQFMADNSEIFGKVFRWDDQVFDYGKVGEYIEGLDTSVEENKKIKDFYDNYLIGNDIQDKFIDWIAGQMNYSYATDAVTGERTENFDDILNNGIINWFAGLCEANGILSEDAIATLETYDLRTNDIYTLIKNFVELAQSDNEVKIDTYYNYILDTVFRTLMKTMLGQKAVVGTQAAVLPDSFNAAYTDLALLYEISGGKAYYQDADKNYYDVTITKTGEAENAAYAVSALPLTWENGIDINFEAPKVEILTGANAGTKVAEYRPTSEDYKQLIYSTYAEQIAAEGFEVAGTTPPELYTSVMTDENKGPEMSECFGVKVSQGENEIANIVIGFDEIEEYVNGLALDKANEIAAGMVNETITACSVKEVAVAMAYEAWATEDEFIVQVNATASATVSVTAFGFTTEQALDASAWISNPVAVIVLDDLSGDLNIDDAKALLDFVNTDFVIDNTLLDFAENYDEYNGVVGQANRVLVGLVKMFVNEDLGLKVGGNEYLTDNLQILCDKANSMMAAAEEVINNEEYKAMLETIGVDMDALLADFDLDILYAIDFSSVEALWVSVINLGLDMIDDGTNATITEIHTAVDNLENLDAMAVAMADYLLAKCIPDVNTALADLGLALTVPTATDAKTVEDGAAKDIIMTKLVDVLYEAAVWGVGFANDTVNELIGHVEGEINADLPTVAFELKVTKANDWQTTLAALVDRVYELADGIIIACDNTYTDTFDKIAAVANAILPLGSLASNCASDNFAFDVNKVMGFLFDDGLEGDLEGFLRLFETKTKTQDVAADCSVTEALINASEHIVDSIFPETVIAENYVGATSDKFTQETVQEYFTSAENDAVIASNNMDSINARKADLVPAALNLIREAGILPYFAKCDKEHIEADAVLIDAGKEATCTENGYTAKYGCADCGYVISGGEVIVSDGHDWSAWTQTTAPTCEAKGEERRDCNVCDAYETNAVAATGHVTWSAWAVTVAPTCEAGGVETRTCSCGKEETRDIAATGHADNNGDELCDACGLDLTPEEELGFFAKILAFFRSIIDWFKNLFS